MASSKIAFTCFPLLPTEIRVRIWEEALKHEETQALKVQPLDQAPWIMISNPTLAVLQVNREARYEGRKLFNKTLEIKEPGSSRRTRQLHFRPKSQTLYLVTQIEQDREDGRMSRKSRGKLQKGDISWQYNFRACFCSEMMEYWPRKHPLTTTRLVHLITLIPERSRASVERLAICLSGNCNRYCWQVLLAWILKYFRNLRQLSLICSDPNIYGDVGTFGSSELLQIYRPGIPGSPRCSLRMYEWRIYSAWKSFNDSIEDYMSDVQRSNGLKLEFWVPALRTMDESGSRLHYTNSKDSTRVTEFWRISSERSVGEEVNPEDFEGLREKTVAQACPFLP